LIILELVTNIDLVVCRIRVDVIGFGISPIGLSSYSRVGDLW
jgi:hypothetical protein